MNKVILMGRLVRDPEVRYTTGEKPMAVARYTLRWIEGLRKKANKRQILLIAYVLERQGNLHSCIYTRE